MCVRLVLSLFNSVAWPVFCSRALAAYRRTNELSQRPSLSTQLFLLNCFNAAFCGLCGLIRVYNLPIWTAAGKVAVAVGTKDDVQPDIGMKDDMFGFALVFMNVLKALKEVVIFSRVSFKI